MVGRVPVQASIELGREAFAGRRWPEALEALSDAATSREIAPDDLVLLAWSAHLVGRHADFLGAMERAHRAFLQAGSDLAAARCATAVGSVLLRRGELAAASGWYVRAGRLVEQHGAPCAEAGHLLVLPMLQQAMDGQWEAVHATAAEAAAIGERFDDTDLAGFAVHWQGRALVRLGEVEEGLGLIDASMVAVVAGEVSPHVTGILYCSTIEACQEIWAWDRSREWTEALSRWCDGQPDLLPFTGQCLVHRSELLALRGAWRDALDAAVRAGERITRGADAGAAGAAHYQEGELHRRRGDDAAAEAAYRAAAAAGRQPQPGLALLRLRQGDVRAAEAAIRRMLAETLDDLARARMLPATVEILLAAGKTDEASHACQELERIAGRYAAGLLGAMASAARGRIELAAGDPATALPPLRRACRAWQQLAAPYETARLRVLIGLACRAMDDSDSAMAEFDAARATFEALEARPDLEELDALGGDAARAEAVGLTGREFEVLRLLSRGMTNRSIGDELSISVKTVERHVSSILMKLAVESRTAAATYAHQHRLLPSGS